MMINAGDRHRKPAHETQAQENRFLVLGTISREL